ncbi:MAG: phosphoribosyltransferase [Planctomycetes bacterium]|nr:phosphoribosyltransferase [Planctomycetota bacterium]
MRQDPVTNIVFSDNERYDGATFIVDQLWKTECTIELKKRLEGMEPVFITMPSTSRQNVLPQVLAGKLQEELGGTILSGEVISAPLFDKEMKTVPSTERPFVPREFFLHSPYALRKETAGKAVVVVEDVFSSGASAKAFCDTLKDSKIQVHTVAGLLGDSRLVAEPQMVIKLQKR